MSQSGTCSNMLIYRDGFVILVFIYVVKGKMYNFEALPVGFGELGRMKFFYFLGAGEH